MRARCDTLFVGLRLMQRSLRRAEGAVVNTRRILQGTRSAPPLRTPPVTEPGIADLEAYDDTWPRRLPSSARRYQALAAVPPQRNGNRSENPAFERHTIPPRRTARERSIPHVQAVPLPADAPFDEEPVQGTRTPRSQSRKVRGEGHFHWLVFVGIILLVMIFGWVVFTLVGTWWQTTLNDWQYGSPRTFQIDAVVGYGDSPQHPSHFIAMNLNRHIVIIEIPGGDVAKSVVFSGPTLLGPGQDLTPVTLTFQDVNHDGKVDMILVIQGTRFVFLNEHGTFVPSTQSPGNANE